MVPGVVIACTCALLAQSGCKHSNSFFSVDKRKDQDGGGLDAATASDAAQAGDGGKGMDGGLGFDAAGATMDAAVLGLDASLDLPDGTFILPDGAIVLPDGDIIDIDAALMRYVPEIDVSTCAISENDTYSTNVDIGDEGGFSLVPGQTGFGLAYRGLGSGSCAQDIDVMHIPATTGFPQPHSVLPDCKRVTDVALLGQSDGWRVAWVDNFTNMAELHTLALDLDMNVPDGQMRRQVTDNQQQLEKKPVLREVAGRPLAAWITDDMSVTPDGFRITTQLLDDGAAEPNDVVKESDGQRPQSIALSQIGEAAAALGWVGPLENPGVWLQRLNMNGAAVDVPIKLTDKVAASSSIELADRVNGGAAIYSIEIDGYPQVRFRRLDVDGMPLADERTIVGPPLRAQGASLATLGGGYAVAYRALPGGDITEPEVRLTFVTKEGNVIRDAGGKLVSFPIGPATLAEGRTYVSVSVEGEIMIAWIDADPSGAAHNLLRVVRRHLDCRP